MASAFSQLMKPAPGTGVQAIQPASGSGFQSLGSAMRGQSGSGVTSSNNISQYMSRPPIGPQQPAVTTPKKTVSTGMVSTTPTKTVTPATAPTPNLADLAKTTNGLAEQVRGLLGGKQDSATTPAVTTPAPTTPPAYQEGEFDDKNAQREKDRRAQQERDALTESYKPYLEAIDTNEKGELERFEADKAVDFQRFQNILASKGILGSSPEQEQQMVKEFNTEQDQKRSIITGRYALERGKITGDISAKSYAAGVAYYDQLKKDFTEKEAAKWQRYESERNFSAEENQRLFDREQTTKEFDYQKEVDAINQKFQDREITVQERNAAINELEARANIAKTNAETAKLGAESATDKASTDTLGAYNLANTIITGGKYKAISGPIQTGSVPFTGGAETKNQYNQLKGILSLENRAKLKGSGAVSDFESKTLEQAASSLGRNLGEAEMERSLKQVRGALANSAGMAAPVRVTNQSTGETKEGTLDRAGVNAAISQGYLIEYN